MFFDHILIHFSHFYKYKLHFLLLNLNVDNQYNIHSFFHKMHIMKDEHNLFLNIYFVFIFKCFNFVGILIRESSLIFESTSSINYIIFIASLFFSLLCFLNSFKSVFPPSGYIVYNPLKIIYIFKNIYILF